MRMVVPWVVIAALALACGDTETGGASTTGGGGRGGQDDGKLHPDPNGVRISEAEACDQLQQAFTKRLVDLNCSTTTTRLCPGFVRVSYDPDCVMFDQGSVQGCVDHWNEIFSCDLLADDSCVATVYPGSEPADCT